MEMKAFIKQRWARWRRRPVHCSQERKKRKGNRCVSRCWWPGKAVVRNRRKPWEEGKEERDQLGRNGGSGGGNKAETGGGRQEASWGNRTPPHAADKGSTQGSHRAGPPIPVPLEAPGALCSPWLHAVGVWYTFVTLPWFCNHIHYWSDMLFRVVQSHYSHLLHAETETHPENMLKRQILCFSSFYSFWSFRWSTVWSQETPDGNDSLRFILEEEGREKGGHCSFIISFLFSNTTTF